jgi:transketolase
MEGISQEAIALAGHLKLSHLILLFDDNGISIDGKMSLADSTDQLGRFVSAGWNATRIDGHDVNAVATALEAAQNADKPSMIACRTIIGFGAPNKQGTAATHGAALGVEEVAAARKTLGWEYPPFVVPEDILAMWRKAGARARAVREAWTRRHASHARRGEFDHALSGSLPSSFANTMDEYKKALAKSPPTLATRNASQNALEVINPAVPEIIGGSADLTGSNNTKTKDLKPLTASDYGGRYIHYGVREHAMAAAMSGLSLHGGIIPYGGTFLIFTDYCRPAIRLSALMGQRVIYVMTHDSIGQGEDGPTHQPIEHLAALRAMPNLLVFRPADTVETAECWQLALANRKGPSILALTRQALPTLRTQHTDANLCARGGYQFAPAEGKQRVTLIATGSELSIAVEARAKLQAEGIGAAVVSLPCWELFDRQPIAYRESVLGAGGVRVAIEAAGPFGWERYIGADGGFVGMTGFGASAPGPDLYKHFGITADAAVAAAKERL